MATEMKNEDRLISKWIEPNPHKPGPAEALVLPHHVSVWALIELWLLDGKDDRAVASQYDLPIEAVEAATRHYRRHKAEVDARIERNNAFFAP